MLNRQNGKLISGTPFVTVTWAKGIDAAGRPIEVPEKRPRTDIWARDVCPGLFGAKNWQPISDSPQTGYVYIPSFNLCMDIVARKLDPLQPGSFYLGEEFDLSKIGPGGNMSEMQAWDPVRREPVWSIKEDLPYTGGALSTAGLVFYGKHAGLSESRGCEDRAGAVAVQHRLRHRAGPDHLCDRRQAIRCGACGTAHRRRLLFLGTPGAQALLAMPEGGAVFAFELPDADGRSGQAATHQPGERRHVRLQHHQHADQGRQAEAVEEDEAEDVALQAVSVRRGASRPRSFARRSSCPSRRRNCWPPPSTPD